MIGPEIAVPDVTEAVIGYRQLLLQRHTQHNYRLMSPYQDEPWSRAELRAACRREIRVPEGLVLPYPPKPHSAPAKDCGCGIYAYFEPCPVGPRPHYYGHIEEKPGTPVACVVLLSGRLEVHARGMRAERARLCALGLNERLDVDEEVALREIGLRFEAAVVDEHALEHLAPEYGTPLAACLRPGPPAPPEPPEPPCDPIHRSHARVMVEFGPPEPRHRTSRWEHVPVAINVAAGAGNGAIMASIGPAPLSVASCGFSLGVAALLEAKRRRRRG